MATTLSLIHDGTNIVGTVDGGAGFDSLNANIAGIADLGAVSTFEELIKSGAGTLNINGPAPSDFVSVEVQGGTLNIAAAGSLNGVQNATVASGASLIVDGSFIVHARRGHVHRSGRSQWPEHDRHARRRRYADDPGWRRPERAGDARSTAAPEPTR